jgi:multisubunit Na+/H+ antiporter MnhC subunit
VIETVELTDIVLRVVGAFYAFAGFVATRAAMMSRLLDQALAAISLQKTKPAETAQSVWLLVTSAIVLAGGVFLLAGMQLAAWTFAVSALGQAAYIYVLAPRYFDREDPPDAQGRQRTTNAFVIYTAATAFILWAAYRGRLVGVGEVSTPVLVAVGGALLLYGGYVAKALWWQPRKSNSGFSEFSGAANDEPSLPPHESKRIKVMADYQCDPLWALDEERYGCFAPEMLDLSPQLAADLNAWAVAYDTSRNLDDPANSHWTDAQHAAHAAEGRRLAGRLKRERPDLMVYVMEPDIGVVEIHSDERI